MRFGYDRHAGSRSDKENEHGRASESAIVNFSQAVLYTPGELIIDTVSRKARVWDPPSNWQGKMKRTFLIQIGRAHV